MRRRRTAISAGVRLLLLFLSSGSSFAQWNPLNAVTSVNKQPDSVVFTMQKGTLRLTICSDSIVRVTYSVDGNFPDTPSYVVTKTGWPDVAWTMESTDGA